MKMKLTSTPSIDTIRKREKLMNKGVDVMRHDEMRHFHVQNRRVYEP